MIQDTGLKIKVPTTVVIFGVTGDLSRKKILPALFDLYVKGLLPDRFQIVGFSRRSLKKEEFQVLVSDSLNGKQEKIKKEFLKQLSYVVGNFTDLSGYHDLAKVLEGQDGVWGVCSNKLLYLAVPPEFYDEIFTNLKKSGLSKSCLDVARLKEPVDEEMLALSGWTRVLVEKPFGRDLATAKKLENRLSAIFKEDQIFRIDHYLAKETIQNILSFRFANSLFESLWNGQYIDRIEIRLLESGTVAERGSFYDSVGALRDVGQNHLMQMLAVVTMDKPEDFSCTAIRQERARVLSRLKSPKSFKEKVLLGQYVGYQEESGVKPQSKTETYFKLNFSLSGSRWRDTSFSLESGKAVGVDLAEIKIYFKPEAGLFNNLSDPVNVITFSVQPNEGIVVKLWGKKPGFAYELVPTDLSFYYGESPLHQMVPDAYERLLHDALLGDQTLFATTEEVRSAWDFMTKILSGAQNLPLVFYKPGSLPEVKKK